MKIGFFGDVVGKAGRRAVKAHLPELRAKSQLDFVVVNAENAAGGFGITQPVANELYDAGADCLTLGNHAWDKREVFSFIGTEDRLLRVSNYSPTSGVPGRGAYIYELTDGRKVGVISVMGELFMQRLGDPFLAVDRELRQMELMTVADAIILDVHAEATSEKMAMGHHCDGRVSLVVGTHTHVPTADTQVLPGGTAYQSDAGMCGDYLSVIGMNKDVSLEKFTSPIPTSGRNEPANGEGTMCGIIVVTDDKTGLATSIEQVRIGGRIGHAVPAEMA